MNYRNVNEWSSVVLLYMLCWLFVFIIYTSFWGTEIPRDLVVSALITLGLLLLGVPGVIFCVWICQEHKERLSPFMVFGIVVAGLFLYAGYQAYTDHREKVMQQGANKTRLMLKQAEEEQSAR